MHKSMWNFWRNQKMRKIPRQTNVFVLSKKQNKASGKYKIKFEFISTKRQKGLVCQPRKTWRCEIEKGKKHMAQENSLCHVEIFTIEMTPQMLLKYYFILLQLNQIRLLRYFTNHSRSNFVIIFNFLYLYCKNIPLE